MSNDIYTTHEGKYLKVTHKLVPEGKVYIVSLPGLLLVRVPTSLMLEVENRNLQGIAYFNPEDCHE